VTNLAADGCFGFEIALERLVKMYDRQYTVHFEPESFPCVRWYWDTNGITPKGKRKQISISIFSSGAYTITGTTVGSFLAVCQ